MLTHTICTALFISTCNDVYITISKSNVITDKLKIMLIKIHV
jgi:hypothetical protein